MVELREITKDNFDDVLRLKVAKNQESFVSSTSYSLAQAWAYKNTALPFAIYADDILVGFIMLGYYEAKNQYTLWKFLIDEQHQNKGYGKKALKLGIEYLIDKFNVTEVFTGVAFENSIAKHLYHSIGFEETGRTDDTSLEMKLIIDRLEKAL